MKKLSLIQFWRLCWFSKPACDRALYKLIARRKPRSIVHCGIAGVRQAAMLIAVAQRSLHDSAVKYVGIDMFDARPKTEPPLTLKEVHRALAAAEAKTRLIPGNVCESLSRAANQLLGTDLLVISINEPRAALDACWYFLPRMLNDNAVVLLRCEYSRATDYEILTRRDVERLALTHNRLHPKAA